MADEKLPRDGVRFDAKDIAAVVVYEANGAKVTAFEVDPRRCNQAVLRLASRQVGG